MQILLVITWITHILPSVLSKQGKGRERPKYCLEREREENGRERPKYLAKQGKGQEGPKYCRENMLLRKRPQECNAAIQECPSYIAATKRPQECNAAIAAIQEYTSYIAATSDSLSLPHEHNSVTLETCTLMCSWGSGALVLMINCLLVATANIPTVTIPRMTVTISRIIIPIMTPELLYRDNPTPPVLRALAQNTSNE